MISPVSLLELIWFFSLNLFDSHDIADSHENHHQ
jgi:hypothetical protein